MVEKLVSEKNKTLNKTFDVKDEMKQLQTKIDLLTNQLEWGRNKQFTLSQEESKTKQLIMEKKEFFYNLVKYNVIESSSKILIKDLLVL